MIKYKLLALASLLFLSGNLAAQRKFVEDNIEGKPFFHTPRTGTPQNFQTHPAYRTYDGTNNNISSSKRQWGSTDIALYRELPAQYGAADTKNEMNGATRPSPRQISNVVCDEPVTQFNDRELSAMVYVWGQFLDHDMTLTPAGNTEFYPVILPINEPLFTVGIPFMRSEICPGTGVTNNREQMNLNTAWIDGSQVYGSDSIRALYLRTLVNGKMKTSSGDLLPYNTNNNEATGTLDVNAPSMASDADHTAISFVAGDVRAVEHPGILALHTVFVREHNRICDRLISQGLTNDEEMYQTARKEVGALLQVITYQEFLPAIGISLSPYNNYNANARPDISNSFATAGYRIGHTMVADDILLRDDECEEVGPSEVDLIDAFFNPQLIIDNGIEAFLKGFAAHTQYETDTKVNDILRNFLFGSPTATVRSGLDLASINIQRGRDHGLPPYSEIRAYYTGLTITSFSQITSNTTLSANLQTLYGTVDNVDLWIGILAEDHLANKSVGATMHAMLKSQFEKLRDGDYYFYKNDPYLPSNIRNQIKHTSFAELIQRNTTLTSLQENVFFSEPCPGDSLEDDRMMAISNSTGFLMTAYPNPVSDNLNLEIQNVNEPCAIKLFGPAGNLVKSIETSGTENKITWDLMNLTNGLYVLQMTYGNQSQTIRLVKTE